MRTIVTLGIAAGLLLAGCSSTTASSDSPADPAQAEPANETTVRSSEYFEGTWPLTVDSGTLRCDGGSVSFVTADGQAYAVNGTALDHTELPAIDAIWAPDPHHPDMKIGIGDLIARGLALCSGADPGPPPPPALASINTDSLPAGSFATINDFRDAYVNAGGDCSGWAGAEDMGEFMRGDCTDTSVLLLYPSTSAAAADAKHLATITGPLVVGPNWIVNGEATKAIAKAMGGTFVKGVG